MPLPVPKFVDFAPPDVRAVLCFIALSLLKTATHHLCRKIDRYVTTRQELKECREIHSISTNDQVVFFLYMSFFQVYMNVRALPICLWASAKHS